MIAVCCYDAILKISGYIHLIIVYPAARRGSMFSASLLIKKFRV